MARQLTDPRRPLSRIGSPTPDRHSLDAPCPSPQPAPCTPTPRPCWPITGLGILGTGVTFYLNYRMIAEEGPTSAATVGYLLPVVSVALGALVLDE